MGCTAEESINIFQSNTLGLGYKADDVSTEYSKCDLQPSAKEQKNVEPGEEEKGVKAALRQKEWKELVQDCRDD